MCVSHPQLAGVSELPGQGPTEGVAEGARAVQAAGEGQAGTEVLRQPEPNRGALNQRQVAGRVQAAAKGMCSEVASRVQAAAKGMCSKVASRLQAAAKGMCSKVVSRVQAAAEGRLLLTTNLLS